MGKGNNTTTTSSTSAPDPTAAADYQALLQKAQGVAATPYQAYSGELTAPVNSQQQAGIAGINANANSAAPYVQNAAGMIQGAANPLTAAQIQQYQNPYTQQVVDATQAQFNRQNAQQQAGLTGNTIAQGALGGNRSGVAAASLAGQQQTSQAPVIAGLYNSSYQNALQTANQQFQTNPLSAAYSLGNLGISGQNAALAGAGAQVGAGTLQQQTQQAQDTANYGQYAQQQGYPFQTLQWLAGIDTGVGSQLGGTSNGTTTAPPPNPLAQYGGLGLAAAGLFLKNGGVVKGYADGGAPTTPWSNGPSWIPQISIHGGSGAPHASAPSAQQPGGVSNDQWSKLIGQAGKVGQGLSGPAYGGGSFWSGDAFGGSSSSPLEGLSASDYGAGFRRGGVVPRMADGGSFDDRFNGSGDPSDSFDDRFIGMGPDFSPDADDKVRKAYLAEKVSPAMVEHLQNLGVAMPSTPGGVAPMGDDNGVATAGLQSVDPAAMQDWRNANPLPKEIITAGAAPKKDDDDDDAPTAQAYSGDSGGFRGPTGVAPGTYRDTVTPPSGKDDSGWGIGHALGLGSPSPALRSGLLAAGLGMLASRSPNLGNAIGEGGLHGVGAYGASVESERKAQTEALKLAYDANKAAKDLALRTGSQQETMRHNHATEAAADKSPSGYQKADDGTLKFIKGGPHDPETIAEETRMRTKKGTELDDDTVDAIAQRVAQGDTRAVVGLGRNPAAIVQIQKRAAEIFKEQGLDHEAGAKAILANIADQAGRMTAERTQAGIAAKLAVYGRNVDNAIGVAEQASKEANRTDFTPVNKAINAFKTQSGDPKIVALGQSLNTLTNEYARAIGSGHGTVHDKEQAEQQLNQARSHDQLVAIMGIMRKEVQMTRKSMPEAREEMHELYSRPSSDRMIHGSATQPSTAFTPPSGAVSQVHNGKTYWYDPATHQPIPGQ